MSVNQHWWWTSTAKAKWFTKLDLAQAYTPELDEESRQYVAVNTHRGHLLLPFGIASAPAVFQ